MKKEYAEYLLQKTREDYNRIAEDFSRTRRKPWEETQFLFNNYLISGDKVLDLGSGNGRYYPFFAQQKAEYVGVDNSEELIKEAKEKYPEARFITADVFKLPFPENYFDAVFSMNVLHHIPSREFRLKFLNEAKRVLRSEGILVLTVWRPCGKKGRSLLFKYTILKFFGKTRLDFGDVFEPWGKDKILLYRRHFSKKELEKLAAISGFKIKESGTIKNSKGNRQNIYLVAKK